MTWFKPKSLLDKAFEYGIILKGIDGLLELIAGILLFFVTPSAIQGFIGVITQKELLEDPHDLIANFLIHSSAHITTGATMFAIIYLLVHAGVKLTAVIGLLRNKMWAYPFSFITLGILLIYQIYSIFEKGSIGMILLTVFDIVIIWLIWREYKKKRLVENV